MTQLNTFDSDQQWFAYHDNCFETFRTKAEAVRCCEEWLDEERGGVWSDETMNIAYGRIHGGCMVTEERELTEDERESFDDEVHSFEERKIVPFESAGDTLLENAWSLINIRRGHLIDERIKASNAGVPFLQRDEFERLQEFADDYLDANHPIRTELIDELEEAMERKLPPADQPPRYFKPE